MVNGLGPRQDTHWLSTLLRHPSRGSRGVQGIKASLYPDPKLSPAQFLNITLPRQSHHLPQVHVNMCFKSLPANAEPTHLHDRFQGPAERSPVALIPSTRNAECTGHRKTGMVLLLYIHLPTVIS